MPFFSASGISPYNKTSGGAAAPLPDASAYIIAADITDPAEQAAANQFVLDLSGRGSTTNNTNQWSKHYALYPMSPTSLTAAAYNIKDPTEYKIAWYNNPTHSLNGVSGNGVDQYGDTKFNLANDTASLNISIGAWISANNTLAQADMGAQNTNFPNSGAMLFPYNAGTHDASTVGEYTLGTTPMSTDRDEFMLVQNNGTNLQKFRNGVSYYNAPQALGTADSNNAFILARNLNGANALSSKGTSFNNISEHLTQNEITDLYDAMNTYNVSMSRNWIPPFEFGNALQFGGVDDYVSMTPITESSTWFLSFWINGITNTGSYMYLFGFDAASGTRGGIGISLGGTAFGLSFGGLYYYNGSVITDLNVNINPSSWTHVAINATPTSLQISLNGGASVNTSASVPSNSLNQIGTLDLSSFGQIIYDEIGFLSGSNGTTQNITDLYNGGNGESFTTVMGANNLNLHLNESGTDRIAIDSGGSGNDGTLNNFPTSGMWVVNRAGQTPTVMYPDWDVVEANITVSGGGTATNKILRTGAGGYQGALDSLMGLDDFVFDYIVGSVNENFKFFGLSNQNAQAQSMDMLFGFFLVTINDVRIRENQGDKHSFTVIQGDKITIQRVGGTIQYYKNNVLIFNSTLVNSNEVYPIGLPGDPNVFVEGIKITGFIYGS